MKTLHVLVPGLPGSEHAAANLATRLPLIGVRVGGKRGHGTGKIHLELPDEVKQPLCLSSVKGKRRAETTYSPKEASSSRMTLKSLHISVNKLQALYRCHPVG
jgi:hypothetical protein